MHICAVELLLQLRGLEPYGAAASAMQLPGCNVQASLPTTHPKAALESTMHTARQKQGALVQRCIRLVRKKEKKKRVNGGGRQMAAYNAHMAFCAKGQDI